MDQRIINLFDEYTHKPLSRKAFIKKLSILTGSTAAAMSILPLLETNYAKAAAVSAIDGRLETGYIKYAGDGVEMRAYLAQPKGAAKLPGVIIIHENRGLNPHIEDVTRRVALEGFIAIAPDALSVFGGTPQDADEARGMFAKLDGQQTINNFAKAGEYLSTRNDFSHAIGCIGFCWGGAMANNLAVNMGTLKAAIPFYGRQAAIEDVPKIKAAMMFHYAEMDERVNAGREAYEEALLKNGVTFESFMYAGMQHAFHNDTSEARYNEEAAKLAWKRSIDFLSEKLK
ncbi:MAG TPA: dienelactone hydrolase family protein [Cyclobacteriaceae bacterium]|nr:dienelactone hydrolase family protein [Cyclobacteriaceae bacterium]